MPQIHAGISCNLDKNILETALPLFKTGEIDVIEWSFDALFRHTHMPVWFHELLQFFSNEGRLLGHGVYFSMFSGQFSSDQQLWLRGLSNTAKRFNFAHVTEHFGFMTGEDFHKGAPLGVPCNNDALQLAQDRIKRMQSNCNCPVGLENLAFAYGQDDLLKQGQFLADILKQVNGFIILDLHNIYCQVKNFGIPFEKLIELYPLHLVREIHVSGGSWEDSTIEKGRKIRRDTHDDAVPKEVFEYLNYIIPKLPNLQFAILEQMGADLSTTSQRAAFTNDFGKLKSICNTHSKKEISVLNKFNPPPYELSETPYESKQLHEQQLALSNILEESTDFATAKSKLHNSNLCHTDWQIENWDDAMLETAYAISQKWKEGFQ